MSPETNLVSFVLRFVYDEPAGGSARRATSWHAVIRHVQSDEERRFVHWADAVAFIARYVNLGEDTVGDSKKP